MSDIKKLFKKGWANAMINQGTLSLVMTLDDFLISGPYLTKSKNKDDLTKNPNIMIIDEIYSKSVLTRQVSIHQLTSDDDNGDILTYYLLRPYIRGILYGLSSIYQLSLYVPTADVLKMKLYRTIIDKIDIGNQFFEDRVYYNMEMLQRDIIDRRLACLIYPSNCKHVNQKWFRKFALESRPFEADIDTDLTESKNCFDLVEMRGFLEDMHQRFIIKYSDDSKMYFTDMIKQVISEKALRNSNDSNNIVYTSGFYSNSVHNKDKVKRKFGISDDKPYLSDHYETERKLSTKEKGIKLFRKKSDISQASYSSSVNDEQRKDNEFSNLLNEYEDIVRQQLEISQQLSQNEGKDNRQVNKLLCRWNSITLRKSDILKILLTQNDKEMISKKLSKINNKYYEDQYKLSTVSDSELYLNQSSNNSKSKLNDSSSDNNCFVVISSEKSSTNNIEQPELEDFPKFTTWYTKPLVTT